MGRKKISISKINDERNRQVSVFFFLIVRMRVDRNNYIFRTNNLRLRLQNVNLV